MRNLLSYLPGTKFKGSEIKDWISDNLDTSKQKIAHHLYVKYFDTLIDSKYYFLYKCSDAASSDFNKYLIKLVH